MKRSFHNIEPNYKALAKLSIDQQFVAAVPCRIWLPRHIHERPFLTFESTNREHQIIGSFSPHYDVGVEILDINGEIGTSIHATNLFLEKFLIWPQGDHDSLLITFQGEPQRVIESHHIETKRVKHSLTKTILTLTRNFLLGPTTSIQHSYTGDVSVKTVRGHSDSAGPFKNVAFENHYYYVKADDGGVTTYNKLVAVVTSNYPADDIETFEENIKPIINDYLLLASLAAHQRTNIVSWQSRDEKDLVKGWYGNVRVPAREYERRHSHDDCLIDLTEFNKFMNVSTRQFRSFGEDEKELIRHAIYKILPQEDRTIEANILSFFAAVESIILIHRRANDLEFTISKNNSWKKLERALRQAVESHRNLFETPGHMEMLRKMLPLLKRVAFRDAFESYTQEHKIDLSDLWPVFNSVAGATLTDIRNRIIHGNAFEERKWQPLCHAMDNLECVAKRLLLSTLGWDVERSNVSKDFLRRNGWLANSNLISDMQTLAST